ncbi:MAG TPA: hypothetical protein GXZ21_04410 [Clostridiales bacterium]|nr:hypothetical protein [Clostridiales bacterium]
MKTSKARNSEVIIGQEIIMTKWAGLEGTAIIASSKEQELLSKYTSSFVDRAKGLMDYISVAAEVKIAREFGIPSIYEIKEGGVFGALWDIGAASKVGIEADLRKINIKQETVEICEFYDLNPYMLISRGSTLIITDKANRLVDKLNDAGIVATAIGYVTGSSKRTIKNGEERRYLEPPKKDELYKVIKGMHNIGKESITE